ncbi:SPOR domain-containing protein [Desulfothermus okinawensis JCM 13304]
MAKAKNQSRAQTGTKKKSTKGGFHVTLNIRGCIFAGFVFFLAIVWAFILGVIVGRGYGPIDVITPLKKKVLSSPLKATQSKNNTSKEKVLSPTELTFLKKVRQNSIDKEVSYAQRYNKSKSQSVRLNNKRDSNTYYKYVIQISSFKKKEDAMSLADRLNHKNIPAKIEGVKINDQNFYRVLVVLKGGIHDIKTKMELIEKMGFKKYIIREKNRF